MKKSQAIRRSFGEKLFDFLNIAFMCVLVVIMLYPLLYVTFGSLSNSFELAKHSGLLFHPLGFTTNGYRTAFKNPLLLSGFKNTLIILSFGTLLNLVVTTMSAYVLAKKGPMFTGAIMKLCVFTMFFSGGMIPSYLLIKDLNLLNTFASLILPGTISTTNMIIMRTAFRGIPDSLAESAEIDGANEFVIMSRIVVPLSLATIAVIFLYYAVGHWNSWFNAYIYLQKRDMFPLQLVLREILIADQTDAILVMDSGHEKRAEGDVLKYAMMVIGTVPVLMIYPFIQKYFTKGVMIGAIKS